MRRFEGMKKAFAILLGLCMVLQLVPATAFAAAACDEHTPGAAVIENDFPADCINAGSYDTVVYCTVCDAELFRETTFVDQTDHTPGEPEVYRNEPGCDYDGSIESIVYCAICWELLSFESTPIPQTGHIPGEEQSLGILRDPTCTEEGEEQWAVYCTECGGELDGGIRSVPKISHSYEAEVTPPTCTEDGYTTYICYGCDDEYTDNEVEATGHGVINGLTCIDNGDGTHEVHCNDCGDYVGNADCVEFDEDHKCVDCESLEKMSVIFMNGAEEWTSCDCDYGGTLGIGGMPVPVAATGCKFAGWYTEDGTLVYHGMTVTSDLVAYATWEPGTYTVTWISDGEIYDVTSAKIGDAIIAPEDPTKENYHFAGWEPEIPDTMPAESLTITAVWEACSGGTATCADKAVCSTCENPYGELDSTNHAGGTEVKNAEKANCGEDGYTGDTYCKGCEGLLEEGTVIKATGNHSYGNWKVVKEATNTTKGEKQRTCSVCGDIDSQEIAKIAGNPATGDNSQIMLWSSMMLIICAVILALLIQKRFFSYCGKYSR